MTNYTHPQSELRGVLNTGARANLIKPSTGYGFKNMFFFAEEVANKISKNKFASIAKPSKNRFKFYDSLLLIILLRWPYLGKKIFSRLFKAQKISTIFSFLDEKTSLLQEIKIFASLPFQPFIKASCIHIFKSIGIKTLTMAIALTIYFALTLIGNPFSEIYMYSLIAIGLLLIGIPHGAVDHLLKKDSRPLIYFIAKYLLLMALNFILWIYSPKFALALFLLYSSFHFGESELQRLAEKLHTLKASLKGTLVGALILFIVVIGHWQESILLLKNIDGLWPENILNIQVNSFSLYASIASAFICLYLCLQQNKKHFLRLSLLLFIGLFLPLIAAFSLYFICQHSFNAWQDLKTGLSLSSIQLHKKAWPYLLGAIAFFACILVFNSVQEILLKNIWSNFFIFLSCISLPHVFFMHGFYQLRQGGRA
jgi:Brp/Blh family beta-carotene 15,15'-monooxygenase